MKADFVIQHISPLKDNRLKKQSLKIVSQKLNKKSSSNENAYYTLWYI